VRASVQRWWGFTIGRVMAPSDLAVGGHHLRTLIDDPTYGRTQLDVDFVIADEHTDNDEVSCKGH
jgi:hypothetical protein